MGGGRERDRPGGGEGVGHSARRLGVRDGRRRGWRPLRGALADGTADRARVRPPMPRILIVEDNTDLACGLRNNLEIEGYQVNVAEDGPQGLAEAQRRPPDLMILDLMLPGADGFRVLKTLRDAGARFPVLILTARGEESDKVRGLKLGADDYVTKPFGVLELLARVEALLRRAQPPDPAQLREVFRFGEVVVDTATRSVTRAGGEVALTPKRSEEHTSELQSQSNLVCRLLLEKKKKTI